MGFWNIHSIWNLNFFDNDTEFPISVNRRPTTVDFRRSTVYARAVPVGPGSIPVDPGFTRAGPVSTPVGPGYGTFVQCHSSKITKLLDYFWSRVRRRDLCFQTQMKRFFGDQDISKTQVPHIIIITLSVLRFREIYPASVILRIQDLRTYFIIIIRKIGEDYCDLLCFLPSPCSYLHSFHFFRLSGFSAVFRFFGFFWQLSSKVWLHLANWKCSVFRHIWRNTFVDLRVIFFRFYHLISMLPSKRFSSGGKMRNYLTILLQNSSDHEIFYLFFDRHRPKLGMPSSLHCWSSIKRPKCSDNRC